MKKFTKDRKLRRKRRISGNILGSKSRPRVSVFASNRYTYAQLIDDENRMTLVSYSSLHMSKGTNAQKKKKVEVAKLVGSQLAVLAKKKGIIQAVFDRGRYAYKGRVSALAEGLRLGGIKI